MHKLWLAWIFTVSWGVVSKTAKKCLLTSKKHRLLVYFIDLDKYQTLSVMLQCFVIHWQFSLPGIAFCQWLLASWRLRSPGFEFIELFTLVHRAVYRSSPSYLPYMRQNICWISFLWLAKAFNLVWKWKSCMMAPAFVVPLSRDLQHAKPIWSCVYYIMAI